MNVKRIRVKFDGKEFVADVTRIEKIEECCYFIWTAIRKLLPLKEMERLLS